MPEDHEDTLKHELAASPTGRALLCMIDDNRKMKDALDSMSKSVDRIEKCLVGDEKMGHPGIVQRVQSIETKDNDRWKIYSVVAAISAGLSWVVANAPKFFHGSGNP